MIEAVVASHDEKFGLTYLEFGGGRLSMARVSLPPGRPVRLRLAARDVSLTLKKQSGTSILNIIPATVEAMSRDDPAQVTVRLLAGGVPLLACITRKSAEELGLQTGMALFAQIKSIALLV